MKNIPLSRPEEQGISSKRILDFIETAEAKNLELHGFVLLRRGKKLAEGYWKPYDGKRPHVLQSLQKIITSIAVGITVDDGLVDIEKPLITYFPEKAKTAAAGMLNVKVRHLLTCSTGHTTPKVTFDSSRDFLGCTDQLLFGSREDGDFAQSFFEWDTDVEPGTRFWYNIAGSHMLMLLVEQVTGRPFLDFINERIFLPLGMETPEWDELSREKNRIWLLKMRTEDMARFGQMLLNKGTCDGKRIVSQSWIETAVTKHVETAEAMGGMGIEYHQGYGYQFWPCRFGAYRGDGAFGQYCIVCPEKEAVIAINAGCGNGQPILDAVWEHLVGAMGDEALPPDPDSWEQLEAKLAKLDVLGENPSAEPPFTGIRRYKMGEGCAIDALEITFDRDTCSLSWQDKRGTHGINAGMGRWDTEGELLNTPAAARCTVDGEGTFTVDVYRTTDIYKDRLTFTVCGSDIEILHRLADRSEYKLTGKLCE